MHLRVAQNAARLANAGAQPVRERREERTAPEPKVPKEPGERLAYLRLRAGYKTREEAQRAINKGIRDKNEKISLSLYHQHESGIRSITIGAATKYEQHFGVPPGYILYGDTGKYRVPIRGVVGADGIVLKAKTGSSTETVPAPPTEMPGGLAAYRVEGRALSPIYEPGDILYYNEDALKAPADLQAIAGRKCIVHTGTGSIVVAVVVSIAPDGKAILSLPSGKGRRDVTIRRAAPILWTKHAT